MWGSGGAVARGIDTSSRQASSTSKNNNKKKVRTEGQVDGWGVMGQFGGGRRVVDIISGWLRAGRGMKLSGTRVGGA